MNRTLSIWNDLRPFSVGFDELFDQFNNHLEYTVKQNTTYPPYNIIRTGDDTYRITLAVAGFTLDDLNDSSLGLDRELGPGRYDFPQIKVLGRVILVHKADYKRLYLQEAF